MASKRRYADPAGLAESKKGTPHRFRPGVSGNPAGRRPGSKNRVTQEVRNLVSPLVPPALGIVRRHLKGHKDAPDCATCRHYIDLVFGYAFGKPTQRQELRIEDVRERARSVAREIGLDEDLAVREAEAITRGER